MLLLAVSTHATGSGTNSPPATIVIDSHFSTTSLGEQLSYWMDHDNDKDIEQARQAWMDGEFQHKPQTVLSFGLNKIPSFWFHTRLTISADLLHEPWLLAFEHDTADQLSVYLIDANGNLTTRSVATTDPLNAREIKTLLPTVRLPLTAPGTYELFINTKVSGPLIFPMTLSNEKQKREQDTVRYGFLCAYFGALLTMVLYNFFVYLGTRQQAYLFYILYVMNVIVFLAAYENLFLLVFPNAGQHNRLVINASAMMLFVTITAFVRAFIHTRTRTPKIDKFLLALPLLLVAGIPLASSGLGTFFSILSAPLLAVLILSAAVKIWRSGHAEVRFFLVGWLFLILAAIYQALGYLGILPWNEIMRHAVHFGTLCEVILIALALADRINSYKKQKEAAEALARTELENKNQALQESNRLKDEFIATISHELRTPLNGIIGSIELAFKDLAPEEKSHLVTALSSSEKLGTLIDDILLLSELMSGNASIRADKYDVQQIIHELIATEAVNLEQKALKVKTHISANVPARLTGDGNKFKHALRHVISNAIKFSRPGGSVDIIVDAVGESGSTMLSVSVTDSGPGMDQSQLKDLFNAFRQADGSFRRAHGGLGIGLTLVSNIIKLLGGEIQVSSEPNCGTRVDLRFPCVPCEAPRVQADAVTPATENHAGQAGTVRAGNILVVEDNPVNQKVLVAILNRLGQKATCAVNGQEAVDCCNTEAFDLIYMDCQMPVMDGFEATRIIRSTDSPNRAVPIVAVSANATERDQQLCHEVGMNLFLKKPINKEAISQSLVLMASPRA